MSELVEPMPEPQLGLASLEQGLKLSPDQLKVLQLGLHLQPHQPNPNPNCPSLVYNAPQLLAKHFISRNPKMILSMDKGMGKTSVYLGSTIGEGSHNTIILCTKNAMASQRRDILKFFPNHHDKFTFISGTPQQRYQQWHATDTPIKIATFATFQNDCGHRKVARSTQLSDCIVPKWVFSEQHLDALITDEFQRVYRNRTAATFKLLKTLKPQILIQSSGSATSKGPQDIWPALHLCDPKLWSSFWRYVETWCLMSEGPWGKGIDGPNPERVNAWRSAVQSYHVFHRRKDPKDYPPKMRDFFWIDLPAWQKKLHDDLRGELLAEIPDGSFLIASNTLDALYKIRLALICPKALDPSLEVGAGIEAIVDDYLLNEMTHAVVSTPFKKPIPFLREYCHSKGIPTYSLTGDENLGPDAQDQRIKDWGHRGGIIFQTIKYAQSYELLAAENMYFLGYEYDPEENKQAEDRAHRLSATKPINIWYVRSEGTYDEEHIDILLEKSTNTRLMWNQASDILLRAQRIPGSNTK